MASGRAQPGGQSGAPVHPGAGRAGQCAAWRHARRLGMTVERPGSEAEREPTVWEWLRSLLRFRPIPIPEPRAAPPPYQPPELPSAPEPREEGRAWLSISHRTVRIPVAVLLALIAQRSLDQRSGELWVSIVLYGVAGVLFGWAVWAGDIPFERPEESNARAGAIRARLVFLLPA